MKKIEKQLRTLDHRLLLLLEDLKGYSDAQLNRPPKPGKWSPAQVMQHLMLSEKYSLAYTQKKLSFQPELKRAGVLAAIRLFLLNTYLNSPFLFKAPAAIDTPAFAENVPFWELAKTWKQQRLELKAYLTSLPSDVLKQEIYKHPRAGRLSAAGMLKFFFSHFERHEKQIKKALAEVPKQN